MNEPRGRPFAPGNTLGRGRPRGSRNKANSVGQDLLDQYTPQLVANCIKRALKDDDRSAMRICMEHIFPARRHASIRMSLPRIRTAQDLEKAAEKVTQAIGRGRVAPAEGETMMNIFEIRSRIIEKASMKAALKSWKRVWPLRPGFPTPPEAKPVGIRRNVNADALPASDDAGTLGSSVRVRMQAIPSLECPTEASRLKQ
jgi:predicted DNA-binding protein (UPF0251 family)